MQADMLILPETDDLRISFLDPLDTSEDEGKGKGKGKV